MITLRTITTIELANICNLTCSYCVNRLLVKHPGREPGIMSDTVFDRSLELLQDLVNRDTQMEVNMNGTGESFLDPQLVRRTARVKKIMGERRVCLCTNGVNMTLEVCKGLKDAGMDQLDLSPHSPAHARTAAIIMIKVGIPGMINDGVIIRSHNWAGQLEPENRIECLLKGQCDPLIEGRGYILKEGNITPCCYDYRNLGVFGTIFDEDILNRPIRPYALCETCHQVIPDDIIKEYNRENKDNPIYKVPEVMNA